MANAIMPDALEAYLAEVTRNLRGLPPAEISEIVDELRSHVLDRMAEEGDAANLRQILSALGSAKQIAAINLSMRIAAQSAERRSPLSVLRTIVRLAGLSARGFLTFLVSLAGYGFAASWLVTALLKPFWPGQVGLWLLPDRTGDLSLSLGVHLGHEAGRDLLGWWTVPIGLAVG